jgi:predicted transcriptional regulator
MKTMAIRLDDDVSSQLTIIAQLEECSMAELIREAIQTLIHERRSGGDFAARAEAVLAGIDREAKARRDAIQALFGTPDAAPSPAGPKGRARKSSTDPDAT